MGRVKPYIKYRLPKDHRKLRASLLDAQLTVSQDYSAYTGICADSSRVLRVPEGLRPCHGYYYEIGSDQRQTGSKSD